MKNAHSKTIALTTAALLLGTGAELSMASGYDCDGEGKRGKHYKEQREHSMRGAGPSGMMGERMLRKLDWELELTDKQRDQIRELMKERQQSMGDKREQKQDMYTRMRQLDPAAADYQQQVAELATRQAEAIRQSMIERASGMADVYAVLTPEQQAKFTEMRAEWSEKRGKKRERSE